MNKNVKKCKAEGCSQWVAEGHDSDFCARHQSRIDPISALYVDKSPEELEADERAIQYFAYLLHHRTTKELLS